jgi:hypothetical protein
MTYMMDKGQSHDTSVDIPALPVTPTEATNKSRYDERHGKHEPNVVLVLPLNDRVPCQVANVCGTGLATGLNDHPTDM